MERVALYIRVSTDRQAKEGDSLEAQESALIEYAKKNNMEIIDKYIDGGESGQKINRTELTRMLEDVKKNKIDIILITKLDRWFRSVADFYKVQEILTKHKVSWKTIWEEYDTTSSTGEFWLNMSLSLGRMEAKRTGERIDSVFEHKFNIQKTVCSGQKIYGYDISEEKKLIINEKEAEEIRQLYKYFVYTESIADTVEWFRANIKEKSYCSVKLYLKNTAYIGQYKRHKDKKLIEGFSPRIIDDELFYKAQQVFKRNIKKYKRKGDKIETKAYIFTSMLKCDSCGRNLKAFKSRNNNYYLCPSYYLKQGCTTRTTISEKRMEKYLVANIKNEVDKLSIKTEEIKENEIKKNNIPALNKKLKKLSDLYINDIIGLEDYKQKYKELTEQVKNEETTVIKEEIKDYTQLKEFLNTKFENIYSDLDNTEKRKIWRSIIKYIIIENKGNVKNIDFM